jgi:hypothetical protein
VPQDAWSPPWFKESIRQGTQRSAAGFLIKTGTYLQTVTPHWQQRHLTGTSAESVSDEFEPVTDGVAKLRRLAIHDVVCLNGERIQHHLRRLVGEPGKRGRLRGCGKNLKVPTWKSLRWRIIDFRFPERSFLTACLIMSKELFLSCRTSQWYAKKR